MREQCGDADEHGKHLEHRSVLRRHAPPRGGARAGRGLDDVTVPRDRIHERDRVTSEQRRELPLERHEAAGVDLDDAVAHDDVGHEAVDRLLGRVAAGGVAGLQGPVQGALVELADGGCPDRGSLARLHSVHKV